MAAIGAVAVTAWWLLSMRGVVGSADLEHELRHRGRVALIGSSDLASLGGQGTEIVSADGIAPLAEALDGPDGYAVVAAMRASGVDSLLADGRHPVEGDKTTTVRERLGAYEHIEGLRGVYLAPAAALYEPVGLDRLEPEHRDALAHVARRIVAGARPPRVSSFPEPLRRVENVEVMVMLRDRGRARLWRSARGSSVARALTTAAVVARQRWDEREQAMGGPLDQVLPQLDVEVVLLSEDGTLGDRGPNFIERVFTPEHGVAYERRGAWRYVLPDATATAGQGSAVRAYEGLFEEHGLEPDATTRTDVRLYRLVATVLVTSTALSPSSFPSGSGSDEATGSGDGVGSGSGEDGEGEGGSDGAGGGADPLEPDPLFGDPLDI